MNTKETPARMAALAGGMDSHALNDRAGYSKKLPRGQAKNRKPGFQPRDHRRQRTYSKSRTKDEWIASIANRDVNCAIGERYRGRKLPDNDQGNADLQVAIHTMIDTGAGQYKVEHLILALTDKSRDEAVALANDAFDHRIYLNPDIRGELMRVDWEMRQRLGLRQIEAFDVPKFKRIARQGKAKDQRQKERRRNRGVKPRDQWLADNSKSRDKPWLPAGFKTRRTWERHGQPVSRVECRRSEAGTL
jgi:hypothetical protein